MGLLEEKLVERLLDTSPKYKRDTMEQTIRDLLGASRLEQVTGLPARRGGADGGIDGILDVIHIIQGVPYQKKAALNVKVRNSDFSREQLGGFLLDMDREGIFVGIIITAKFLTPDALIELVRKNIEGYVYLIHIRLTDVLAGKIIAPDILIDGRSLNAVLLERIKIMLV
ncbi:restriction endonuclease [Pantoea deleyi]|uniref:restriction endonuclease n=1 Tax=Pantoea deleyi TaxID=470932 RepID=UPI0035D4F0BA